MNRIEQAEALRQLWAAAIPETEPPPLGVFVSWACEYSQELIEFGIARTGKKTRTMKAVDVRMTTEEAARYTSSVLSNESRGIRRFPARTSAATTAA